MQRILVCPGCEEPSFTFWQKQVLGPGRKKRCRRCGALVSVSRTHWIPMLLLSAAFPIVAIVVLFAHGLAAAVGAVVLMVLVGALYQHHLVPLVVRSKPSDE